MRFDSGQVGEASRWARLYEQGGVKEGMAVEGEAKWIPCTGSFAALIHQLKGGLYNALPYYNSRSIPELQRKFGGLYNALTAASARAST